MTDTTQITVKVSPRMLARAEGLRPFVTEESGLDATRADVLRRALALGLRALEKRRSREDEDDEVLEEEDPATSTATVTMIETTPPDQESSR